MDEEWRNMANFGKDAETTGKSETFGIYEEALQMISYCTARKLENEGEYARAIEQYNQNPLFKDSQARSLNCLYLLAAESVEKEEFGKALELYQQLADKALELNQQLKIAETAAPRSQKFSRIAMRKLLLGGKGILLYTIPNWENGDVLTRQASSLSRASGMI